MDFVNEGKNGYIVDNNEDYAKKLYEILYNNNFHMDLEYVKQFNSDEVVMQKYNEFFILRKILNKSFYRLKEIKFNKSNK